MTSRCTYVWRPGRGPMNGCVLKEEAGPSPKRIHYIPDEMPATKHMANGQHYTSKRKFRIATKDAGCVEVGDAPMTRNRPTFDKREYQNAVHESIQKLQQGHRPQPLERVDPRNFVPFRDR